MKIFLLTSFLCLLLVQNNYAQPNFTDLIPANSIFVGVLKGDSINKKFPFDKIDSYSFIEPVLRRIEKLTETDLSFVRSVVLKFDKNGLNPLLRSYVFAESYGGTAFVNFLIPIKDYQLFLATVEKYAGNTEYSIILNNRYLNLIMNNLSLSWQKDYTILTFSLAKKEISEDPEVTKSRENFLLKLYSSHLSSRVIEKKINELEQFNEWENKVTDAGIWVDYVKIANNSLSALNTNEDYRIKQVLNLITDLSGDVYMGSDVAFENGKIIADTKIYCSDALLKFFESATQKPANRKFFKYIDRENYVFYNIASISPEGIYNGYKKMIIDAFGAGFPVFKDLFGIFEIFLNEKEALNLIKGDFFIALNGGKTITTTTIDYIYNPETDEYDPVDKNIEKQNKLLALGFTYGKKSQIMKFIRIFRKMGLITQEKKNLFLLSSSEGANKFYIKLDRKMLIMSNDYDRIVMNKKYKSVGSKWLKDLKNDFYTLNFNFHNLIKMEDSNPGTIIFPVKSTLNELDKNLGIISAHFYRHSSQEKFLKQELLFEIKNTDKNPLPLLFDFFNNLYLSKQKGM